MPQGSSVISVAISEEDWHQVHRSYGHESKNSVNYTRKIFPDSNNPILFFEEELTIYYDHGQTHAVKIDFFYDAVCRIEAPLYKQALSLNYINNQWCFSANEHFPAKVVPANINGDGKLIFGNDPTPVYLPESTPTLSINGQLIALVNHMGKLVPVTNNGRQLVSFQKENGFLIPLINDNQLVTATIDIDNKILNQINEFHTIINELEDIIDEDHLDFFSSDSREFNFQLNTWNTKIAIMALNIIDAQKPLAAMREEIINKLELKAVPDRLQYFESAQEKIENGELASLLSSIISDGYEDDDIFSILGDHCSEIEKVAEAIQCYSLIPASNPYYKEANYYIGHLIQTHPSANSSTIQSLDEEGLEDTQDLASNYATIKSPLTHFLIAEDGPIDQFYNLLAGGEGITPTIRQVGCNVETLLALADEMRKRANKISMLEQQISHLHTTENENIELKKRLELLEKQLSETKSPEHHGKNIKARFFSDSVSGSEVAKSENDIDESSSSPLVDEDESARKKSKL